MAILDLFKKKKEEPVQGSLAPEGPPGMPPLSTDEPSAEAPYTPPPSAPMAQEPQPAFPSPEPHPSISHSQSEDKNFQVINAKLDAIRATLEQLNQRVANLEKVAGNPEKHQQTW